MKVTILGTWLLGMMVKREGGGYCIDCTASLSEGGSLTLLRLIDVRLHNSGGSTKVIIM